MSRGFPHSPQRFLAGGRAGLPGPAHCRNMNESACHCVTYVSSRACSSGGGYRLAARGPEPGRCRSLPSPSRASSLGKWSSNRESQKAKPEKIKPQNERIKKKLKMKKSLSKTVQIKTGENGRGEGGSRGTAPRPQKSAARPKSHLTLLQAWFLRWSPRGKVFLTKW